MGSSGKWEVNNIQLRFDYEVSGTVDQRAWCFDSLPDFSIVLTIDKRQGNKGATTTNPGRSVCDEVPALVFSWMSYCKIRRTSRSDETHKHPVRKGCGECKRQQSA